jgi:hypothetical protein
MLPALVFHGITVVSLPCTAYLHSNNLNGMLEFLEKNN